jgi:ankyrin repeat protein
VQALLNKGAKFNAKDNSGSTAMMVAAGKNRNKIIELLKQAGAMK